jgi:hypothetical protein
VGDELLALNSQRLHHLEDLEPHLSARAVASGPIQVLFCRDGQVRDTRLTPAPPGICRWRLRRDPDANPEALIRRRHWLELVP